MTQRLYGIMAEFRNPEALVEAVRAAKRAGFNKLEVFSPFPLSDLAEELGTKRKNIHLLIFNDITKKAVQEALKHPGAIDLKMVDAQQARRVLDRLVGYKISPLLWDKVRRGLSAGRVQSVALKLVVDREREIDAFVPEEYWNITARLAGAVPPEFDARLLKKDGANVKVGNEADANAILADLRKAKWIVDSVTTKERKKSAVPPFITSKLQQASRFPVKKTMMVAQQLYEGIELPGEDAPVDAPPAEEPPVDEPPAPPAPEEPAAEAEGEDPGAPEAPIAPPAEEPAEGDEPPEEGDEASA